MTRKEAKELLPIVQAFAEGKPIEVFINNQWMDLPEDADLRPMMTKYRIKPEPKYRPFNDAEECWTEMLKHQPVGYIKDENDMYNIVKIRGNSIIIGYTYYNYIEALGFTFIDGTPFGIKDE